MIAVRVEREPFDVGAEIARLSNPGVGGIASFVGIVRGDGGLVSLTLEHYPAMTQAALETLATAAMARWALSGATIVHRVGTLTPGEAIVFVGTAAPHRAAALEACAYLIDRLKTDAPFWKRERFADGRDAWVEARDLDSDAAARWLRAPRRDTNQRD
ncbi:MAG: molybdenum cofactor biosynthesis protein MoaE [Sphingomonadaceae bacterium]